MDLKIATSFAWLIVLAFSLARPVCMQLGVEWPAPNICSSHNGPALYRNAPIYEPEWEVELSEYDHNCSADSVRVVYSDNSGSPLGRDVQAVLEVHLHCTAPWGTAQADLMPAPVNCSGRSSGGDWRNHGFVFQNLNAAGIQPGWNCTVSGSFEIHRFRAPDTENVRAPPRHFVLGCRTVSTTTVPPTTTEPQTTSPATTSESTEGTTTSNVTSTGNNEMRPVRDTKRKRGLMKDIIYAIVIPLITVLLVTLCVTALIVFAALSWKKLQRDRKRTILIFDKRNMVFDPEYVPAVSIEKPLSHRFSVVSNDFLQFLTPLNNGSLHGGNENMAILLEGSSDDKDDVLLHDTTSHVKATDTKNSQQEFSERGIAQAEDPPQDYSSVSHSELTAHHSEVSRHVLENWNTTMDGSRDTLHETKWSASLDRERRDSSSLRNGLSRDHEASGTSLDKHYNLSSGGYVDSNVPALTTAIQGLDGQQPSSSNIFELEMESDGTDSKPLSSISVMKNTNTTSYVDSALIGAQYTGEETLANHNLDSYLYSEDSGVLCINTRSNLSSPLTSFHDHTTDGYVSDGQSPPTDRRRSSRQDESLELDFVTESDSYSTEGDRDEQCLVSRTFQDQNRRSSVSFKDLPMNILDVNYLSLPDDSAQSQGYVTCSDISNSEPLARKMFIPHNPPSSESNPELVMNLDFDSQTHTNQNPVLLSGSGMKMNTDMLRGQQLLSSDFGAVCQL